MIHRKSPKSFYQDMVPIQITAIQSKVNSVLISQDLKPLPMKEGVADSNFITNVENAQRAMNMKEANCDGEWGNRTQTRYMNFLKQQLTEVDMLVSGVEQPKLAAIPIPLKKKQVKPARKTKEARLYRFTFRTRKEHKVVITSTKSRLELITPGKDALYDAYRNALEKGNAKIYNSKGRLVNLSQKGQQGFFDIYPKPTFISQQLVRRKKAKTKL